MTRFSRLLVVAVTLGAVLAPATSQAARPGRSCGSSPSAISQYCENLPSSTGRGTSAPGAPPQQTPTLGTTLPPTAVRAFEHLRAATRKRARKLLSIPAPAARVPLTASISSHGTAGSFPIGVVIALLAVAAAGAGAVLVRRRGRGAA